MGMKDWFKEKLFNSFLMIKSRPSLVSRIIGEKRITRSDNCDRLPSPRIRVAAVQMKLHLVKGVREYVEKLYELTRRSVEEGAQLLVFPEYSGTHLLSLIPGIEKMASGTIKGQIS